MKLGQIIKSSGASILVGSEGTEIVSICCDSRKVKEGSAFIAVKGYNGDGHDYIEEALRNGAVAVIDADRKGFALCADNFYAHPSGRLNLIGITGTNGKTTTVTLHTRPVNLHPLSESQNLRNLMASKNQLLLLHQKFLIN